MDRTGLTCIARVYGFAALALVAAPLRAAGIWTCSDLPQTTTVISHHAVAFGGTRVFVLDQHADEARAILEGLPSFVSRPVHGGRMILCLLFFLYCFVPTSPFAVFLPRTAEVIRATR